VDAFDKQHYRRTRHELTKARGESIMSIVRLHRLQFAQGFSCEGATPNGIEKTAGWSIDSTTARAVKMAKTIAERQPNTRTALKDS